MTNSEMKKQVIEMFLENVPELEGFETVDSIVDKVILKGASA